MENYDYYTIKAAWKGAGVSQRADDIKAAEKISDDLKGNGFIDVVIFGVKAGKREKLEGGKQAKPKAQERPRKAKKTKAQAKAAPKVKTPANALKKQEKKAQDNAGQLDLFLDVPNKNTPQKIELNQNEIQIINYCLGKLFLFSVVSIITKREFEELKTTFEKALNTTQKVVFMLKDNEIRTIAVSLAKQKYSGKYPRTTILNLIEFFKKFFIK